MNITQKLVTEWNSLKTKIGKSSNKDNSQRDAKIKEELTVIKNYLQEIFDIVKATSVKHRPEFTVEKGNKYIFFLRDSLRRMLADNVEQNIIFNEKEWAEELLKPLEKIIDVLGNKRVI